MSEADVSKIFAANLKQIMVSKNIKQTDIVRAFGVAKGTVSGWCSGANIPRTDALSSLSNYLGVQLSDLLSKKSPADAVSQTARKEKDIEKILAQAREQLMDAEGLMFDGEPASPEAIESILSAMKIGIAMAKEENKKYIPKKYRKD